jgi:hypothetical protein
MLLSFIDGFLHGFQIARAGRTINGLQIGTSEPHGSHVGRGQQHCLASLGAHALLGAFVKLNGRGVVLTIRNFLWSG